jgi:hypothetical protein
MAELLPEIFEGPEALESIEGIDEMGELGEGLDSAETEALDSATEEASDQFKNFNEEEIRQIDSNTPDSVQEEVNDAVHNSEVEDISEEQQVIARDEGLDPKQPTDNFKTRLKKVWSKYGSFLKGIGEFSVKAVGEYFKWKFIIDVSGAVLKDIHSLIIILQAKTDPSCDAKLLTNFLAFLSNVEKITNKIDTPLKIVTGASTTTDDKDGLANLFANYFSLRASEDVTETATALLQVGIKVKTNNFYAYRALGLPKDNPTEKDTEKVTKATISCAIAKLSVSDLKAFTDAATKHKETLDKYTKLLDTSDKNAMKLKAALTLPPKYEETFTNLETFITSSS